MLLPDNYEMRVKHHDNLLLPLNSGRMSQVASTGGRKKHNDSQRDKKRDGNCLAG
jgi:hypothetical protein